MSDALDERYEDPDYEALGIDWTNVLTYPACPVCDGESYLLGSLGRREHYRCRDCGIDHSALLFSPAASEVSL